MSHFGRSYLYCVNLSFQSYYFCVGASRLGFPATDVKIVLESDGTEVEDDIYFQTIDRDTIFLILCPGERWLPPGVEALRAGKCC